MQQLTNSVPIPHTAQELEQAVLFYKNHDLSDRELIDLWQAIRDLSINEAAPNPASDKVPGEDSY